MVELTALWLPIVLSAVFVFVASSILHMVLPYHRSDYDKLPNEDAVLDALRAQNAGPGNYVAPHCVTPAARRRSRSGWAASGPPRSSTSSTA